MYSLDLTLDEPSSHPMLGDGSATAAEGERLRFARGMTCTALKPQAARLLESLTD